MVDERICQLRSDQDVRLRRYRSICQDELSSDALNVALVEMNSLNCQLLQMMAVQSDVALMQMKMMECILRRQNCLDACGGSFRPDRGVPVDEVEVLSVVTLCVED